ncbi:histidinol-phosphate transaminase [Robertmurraya sp. P23]|uniref:histidinol-phosphate transaminase n=1 Tax=Robertmurraya sp. P23 TaxID=3436931 RepID=UPI003D98D057
MVGEIKTRKAINNIKSYSPGKPLWEVEEDFGLNKVIKLASNENPIGSSPKAIEAIKENLLSLNRYPDAQAIKLKKAIASKLNVSTNELIVTNGADELITLISETYLEEGDEVIVLTPSFSEYEFGANLMGAKVVPVSLTKDFQISVEAILALVTEKTKIVYICSPNNPTGTYMNKDDLNLLITSLPKKVLLVFDSAYSHFATTEDYTDGISYVQSGYPIIVLQTFSKIYGLAGLRIGFGVAPVQIIESIVRVKEPFNSNSLAQVAATAAIMDEEHVEITKRINTEGREQLYQAFKELNIPYTESMSNFILVHFGSRAKSVFEQLLSKGIIVRYGEIWGLPNYIRISVGTKEENDLLIKALKSISITI